MRKNLITSALVLGSLGAQSGSLSFVGKSFKTELSSGKKIEIILQEEVFEEDMRLIDSSMQKQLSREVLSHEKMIQILNQVRKEEFELNEEKTL